MSARASKTSGHTPGPWRLYIPRGTTLLQIRDEADEIVIALARLSQADARLIAAAPEMHERLELEALALTNLLQRSGEKALPEAARTQIIMTRDRIQALLARIDGTGGS